MILVLPILMGSTKIHSYKNELPLKEQVDRAISIIINTNEYDVAKHILLKIRSRQSDTVLGAKHLLGLSWAYSGKRNYSASYYYAELATKAAQNCQDSALAFVTKGGALFKMELYAAALRDLYVAREVTMSSNDTITLKGFAVDKVISSCNAYIAKDNASSFRNRIKSKRNSIKIFILLKMPWLFVMKNGTFYFPFVFFLIVSVFFFLSQRTSRKTSTEDAKKLNAVKRLIVFVSLYCALLFIFKTISTVILINKGEIDYFTNWVKTYPFLYQFCIYGVFLFSYLFFEYLNKWVFSKTIINGLKNYSFFKQLAWCLIGGVVIVGYANVVNRISALYLVKKLPVQIPSDVSNVYGLYAFISFIISVLIAPVLEEVLFRSIVYRSVRDASNVLVAITLCSFIFLLVHYNAVNLSMLSVLRLLILSIVSSLLYEKTGSILPSIGVHSINNLAAIISF